MSQKWVTTKRVHKEQDSSDNPSNILYSTSSPYTRTDMIYLNKSVMTRFNLFQKLKRVKSRQQNEALRFNRLRVDDQS